MVSQSIPKVNYTCEVSRIILASPSFAVEVFPAFASGSDYLFAFALGALAGY